MLVAGVKTGRNLHGKRQTPSQCHATSIVVCSLYSGTALASLAVAGIITLVPVLMERCLASTMSVGFKGKLAVEQCVRLEAGV